MTVQYRQFSGRALIDTLMSDNLKAIVGQAIRRWQNRRSYYINSALWTAVANHLQTCRLRVLYHSTFWTTSHQFTVYSYIYVISRYLIDGV